MGIFQDTVDAINIINVQYGSMPKWWPKYVKNFIYRNNRKKVYRLVERFKEIAMLDVDSIHDLFLNISENCPPLGNFGICKNIKMNNGVPVAILECKINETGADFSLVFDIFCKSNNDSRTMIRYVLINGNDKEFKFTSSVDDYLGYDIELVEKVPSMTYDEFIADSRYVEHYANRQVLLLAWLYLDKLYRQTGRIVEL